MGVCASSQYTSSGGNFGWRYRVNIIDMEGRLQQLKKPKKAGHVLSHNPNCFICSSESLYVGSEIPHVGLSEELQIDHIYFLLPFSKFNTLLSIQDLCAMAIKANAALAHSHTPNTTPTTSIKHKNFLTNSTLPSVSLGFSH
ncbi:DUF4228 domain protein [Senna tora]|uniref:DUF4228 domain protein n=1 Tax=Senna tora TaxID=362788 RepID=A0A834XA55_9FABA|nr:DUF4228 domain protein [Senna tora]